MAVTGRPLSARNAMVRIGGTTLFAASWDVEPETELLDSSSFECGGFEEQVSGLTRNRVTIEGWWNGLANMHDAPLQIVTGRTLTNVVCYINQVGSANWSFAFMQVASVSVSARVAEKIMYRLQGKADGTFSYPTGAVAAT